MSWWLCWNRFITVGRCFQTEFKTCSKYFLLFEKFIVSLEVAQMFLSLWYKKRFTWHLPNKKSQCLKYQHYFSRKVRKVGQILVYLLIFNKNRIRIWEHLSSVDSVRQSSVFFIHSISFVVAQIVGFSNNDYI